MQTLVVLSAVMWTDNRCCWQAVR